MAPLYPTRSYILQSILVFSLLLNCICAKAQPIVCPPNLDFETGAVSPWSCYTGSCCPITTPVLSGPVANRHTITSGAGVDFYGGFPVVAPGGSFSLKIGNNSTGSQAEKVRYYVHVPSSASNYILVYRFAVVLQNPTHLVPEQPRFQVNLYDSASGMSLPCGYLSYVASSSLPGFLLSPSSPPGGPVYYRAWDSATVNLSRYGGSTITLDFSTGDCSLGAHFGYAYIDLSCRQASLTTACDTSSALVFTAPPGYSSYTWYDSATFSTIYGTTATVTIPNPHAPRTYAVVMAPYSGLGCVDTLYLPYVPTALALHPTPVVTTVCTGTSVPLNSGATDIVSPLTYYWSPPAGLSCTTCASTTATPTVTTVYTVSVSNGYGCNRDTTLTVNVVTGLPATAITGPSVLCAGSTIALGGSPSGGVWSSTAPGVATISATGVVSGISAGTTTISYTATNVCGSATATKVITVNALPVPGVITGPSTVCISSSITMSSSVGGGGWSSSSTSVSVGTAGIVTGLTAGTALISYTVSNSCGVGIATKIVTVTLMPVAGTLSGPDSVCVGNSITITASSSGGTWSFSPAGIASVAAGVVTGIAAGSVVISYVVANACDTVVATKVVFVKPLPVAAIISGPTVVCVGSSIVLTASVPGGTWSSTGGVTVSTTGTVSGLTVGTATISYAITNSCGTTVTTKIITVNPLPNAGAISGGPMVCTSNTITMSATITGGTWSCTSNASITSSGVLTGITAGTATVSYTVTNSCGTAIATTIVTINATPPAGTISGPSRVCVGATITLVESVAGGTWSSSNPAVATISATGVVSGISGGTVNITYTTSTGLCSNRATTTITVDPLAVPGTIIGDPALCALATITLTSTQPGGVWGSSGSVATISPTGVISGLAAGTIIVTYTVTNICGPMIVTKVVSVNPLPNPGIITGPHDVCIGTKITLANSIGGGTWSSSNTAVATISAAGVISTVAPGNTAITYTVTSSAGCKDTTTYFITVWPLPAPGIISGQSKVCANVTVTLHETETGGTWSVNDPRVLSIDSITGEVRAVSPGTVIITYTSAPNGGGCVNIATLPFTVYSQPPFVIKENLSNVTCKGYADASIAVFVENATGSWQFQWSTGSTAHVVSPLAPGVYSVQVTEVSTGCIAGKNYNITEPDSLSISSEVKDELCAQANGVIELKVKGGTTPYYYMWSNKATTGQVVDLPVGTYSVVVTDEHQCKKDYAAAIGDGGCPDIDVKGGLSPNGDGANDLWVIGGLEIYRNNLVLLFDKWGDKVFEQRGYNNKWDGRGTNGSYLPDGTYFYVIKLNAENGAGGKNVLTGSLLIKR